MPQGSLAQRIRAKYPGAYDDLDDAALEKQVLVKHPEYADLAAKPPEAAKPPHGGGVVDALPSIAGTVFSLAGGSKALPTGAAMAALGGAAGEGARQVIRSVQGQWDQVPDSLMGQIKAMGGAGASQATLEGVGRGVGALVAPVAKAAYGLALRPAKTLQKEYGLVKMVNQGFADKVLPNAMGEARAGTLMKASRDEATKIAGAKQTPIKMSSVLQRASDDQTGRAAKELQTAGVTPPIDKIATQIGNVAAANPDMVTPAQLLALRRGADEVADPAFRAARMPGGAGRVPVGTDASVAKSMANSERKTLEDVLGEKFKQANATTRARAGVQMAAKDATMRPNMLTNLLAGGIGATAFGTGGDVGDAIQRALVFRTLFSPTALASGAIALPAAAKYGVRAADMATHGQVGDNVRDALIQKLLGQQ